MLSEGMRRFWGGGAPCRDRWNAFILACISCGRAPALAVAKEDGGGPGLRAALIAPRGLEGALVLANDGDSDIARYEGGRRGCNVGGVAKSSVLVEAKESVASEASVRIVNSGETRGCGGELIFGVG